MTSYYADAKASAIGEAVRQLILFKYELAAGCLAEAALIMAMGEVARDLTRRVCVAAKAREEEPALSARVKEIIEGLAGFALPPQKALDPRAADREAAARTKTRIIA